MLIEMKGPGAAGGRGLDYRLIANALGQARGQWVCLTFTGPESAMLEALAADAERSFARLSEGLANTVFAGADAADPAGLAIKPAAFEVRLEGPLLYLRWRDTAAGGLPAPQPEMPEPSSEEAVSSNT